MDFRVEEFANFRLVCSEWNKVSLPLWRKKARIIITGRKGDESGILTRAAYMTLLRSRKDTYQLKKYPFRDYTIQYWDLNLENRQMLAFWEKVGPLMTDLSLDECEFGRVDDFKKILFELTPNLERLWFSYNMFKCKRPSDKAIRMDPTRKEHLKPADVQKNLKSLHGFFELEDDVYDDEVEDKHWDILPITWIEFFLHFPNLKAICMESLVGDSRDPNEELMECVKSLEIIRNKLGSEYFANLKKLNLNNS